MPVTDDLRGIAKRANGELDAVHDFFVHSKAVWRSFVLFVNDGYRTEVDNAATGTRIDQDELVRLAPQYTQAYLATFTFRQFVSAFETFLFEFLHRLLKHNPWQFARSTLEFQAVLEANSRDEIISGILRVKLNELRYGPLREWFGAVNKAAKLDCPSDDEIDALAEIKAARDVLEHNAGVANDIYCRKAKKKARYAPGDYVEIDDTYHLECWTLMKKVVADVTDAAIAKLEPS